MWLAKEREKLCNDWGAFLNLVFTYDKNKLKYQGIRVFKVMDDVWL